VVTVLYAVLDEAYSCRTLLICLIERRARCACDLRSRLFAHVALSLLLFRQGESLGLVPGVFGVDSLLKLHNFGRRAARLTPLVVRGAAVDAREAKTVGKDHAGRVEQRFVDAVAGAEIKQANRHEPRSKKKQYDADFIAAGALWSPTRPAQTSA
jgi:hypothetical protein